MGDIFDVRIELNRDIRFEAQADGGTVAAVSRGDATTRFKIDPDTERFLHQFREPHSLNQAAAVLEAEGYRRDNVLAFGRQLLKTPLLCFAEAGFEVLALEPMLVELELELVSVFKDRKFDGVYRVRTRDGEDRVLKLLRAPPADPNYARIAERLRNEYATLRHLDGVAAVVRPLAYAAAPFPCFAMEYIEGANLTERILGDASAAERLDWTRQLAETMAAVQRRDVVHGDLHSSNFLVDRAGRLRAIDFDCAFVAGAGLPARLGGAPHFLPPERLLAHWYEEATVAPTRASDLYQIGVIAYFTLSGRPPFRGRLYSELVEAIRQRRFEPLARGRDGEPLPLALCAAIHACLDHDPAARPATLDELVAAFSQG